MEESEVKARLAAALAIASLSDSVPVSPEMESPPEMATQKGFSHLQVQSGPSRTSADSVAQRKMGRPQLPKLHIGEQDDSGGGNPSPSIVSGKTAVLPKVPKNMLVKNALVQKIQGSAAQRHQIAEEMTTSDPGIAVIPEVLPPKRGRGRGRGRGRPRGSGKKQLSASQRREMSIPVENITPTNNSPQVCLQQNMPVFSNLLYSESSPVAEAQGSITGNISPKTPISTVQATITTCGEFVPIDQGSSAQTVVASISGNENIVKEGKHVISNGANNVVGATVRAERHVPLHKMKLPDNFKEEYQKALIRQQMAGLSPITPPDNPLGQMAKSDNIEKEQSEPLDLSKDKGKEQTSSQVVLSPGQLPAGLVPVPVPLGNHPLGVAYFNTLAQGNTMPLPLIMAPNSPFVLPQIAGRMPYILNPSGLGSSQVLRTSEPETNSLAKPSESDINHSNKSKSNEQKLARLLSEAKDKISEENKSTERRKAEPQVSVTSSSPTVTSTMTSAAMEQNKKLPPKKRRLIEQTIEPEENPIKKGRLETQISIDQGMSTEDSAYGTMDTMETENDPTTGQFTFTSSENIIVPSRKSPLLSADSGIGSLLRSPSSLPDAGITHTVKGSTIPVPKGTISPNRLQPATDAVVMLRSLPMTKNEKKRAQNIQNLKPAPGLQVPRFVLAAGQKAPGSPLDLQSHLAQQLYEQYGKSVNDSPEPGERIQSLPHDIGKPTKAAVAPQRQGLRRVASMTHVQNIAPKPSIHLTKPAVRQLVNGHAEHEIRGSKPGTIVASTKQRNATTTRVSEDNEITESIPNEVDNPDLLQECQRAAQADDDGDLPLHIAVVHENIPVIQKLLYMMQVAKIPIDYYNNLRQTPLHLGIITKNEQVVAKLLLASANPNLPDRKGQTGMHLAIHHKTRECLSAIVDNSTFELDIDFKNYEGFTPLHLAVIGNHLEYVQLLIDAGCSLDITDGKSGRTALFHAAEGKLFNIASLLLQKGANVNIVNYAGNTPVQAANGRGHTEMVALFIKYGADAIHNPQNNDNRGDQKMIGVSQMSQVKETVKETMLKRQRKKQQKEFAGRTVNDLLKNRPEAPEQYNDSNPSPRTPTPPIQENVNFSPISIVSSDSVPQSPVIETRLPFQSITVPVSQASTQQGLIDLQKALLEKIAPTPIVISPQHEKAPHAIVEIPDSPPAMETMSVQKPSLSPSGLGKRSPLTIDPNIISIPAKKARTDEVESEPRTLIVPESVLVRKKQSGMSTVTGIPTPSDNFDQAKLRSTTQEVVTTNTVSENKVVSEQSMVSSANDTSSPEAMDMVDSKMDHGEQNDQEMVEAETAPPIAPSTNIDIATVSDVLPQKTTSDLTSESKLSDIKSTTDILNSDKSKDKILRNKSESVNISKVTNDIYIAKEMTTDKLDNGDLNMHGTNNPSNAIKLNNSEDTSVNSVNTIKADNMPTHGLMGAKSCDVTNVITTDAFCPAKNEGDINNLNAAGEKDTPKTVTNNFHNPKPLSQGTESCLEKDHSEQKETNSEVPHYADDTAVDCETTRNDINTGSVVEKASQDTRDGNSVVTVTQTEECSSGYNSSFDRIERNVKNLENDEPWETQPVTESGNMPVEKDNVESENQGGQHFDGAQTFMGETSSMQSSEISKENYSSDGNDHILSDNDCRSHSVNESKNVEANESSKVNSSDIS